jgi:serine/threonine protein kinase
LNDAAKSVAVKQLKRDATDDSPAAIEFFKEMQLMMQLGRHNNVISLIGVCRTERPLLMLVELADMGELLRYIRERRPDASRNIGAQLGADDFVTFAAQVASGMEFLHQNRVGLYSIDTS